MLILIIEIGLDIIPAIGIAYENPEVDLLDRPPRDTKRDHLLNSKLISFAYM